MRERAKNKPFCGGGEVAEQRREVHSQQRQKRVALVEPRDQGGSVLHFTVNVDSEKIWTTSPQKGEDSPLKSSSKTMESAPSQYVLLFVSGPVPSAVTRIRVNNRYSESLPRNLYGCRLHEGPQIGL